MTERRRLPAYAKRLPMRLSSNGVMGNWTSGRRIVRKRTKNRRGPVRNDVQEHGATAVMAGRDNGYEALYSVEHETSSFAV